MKVQQLYEAVTASIVKDLEAGVAGWLKPWKTKGGGVLPFNYATSRSYSGINIPILWFEKQEKGYGSSGWLTYKQAQAIGGQVRAGEKSTTIVFTKKYTFKQDDDVEKQIKLLKTFAVFNVAQIDGLEAEVPAPVLSEPERDDQAIRFIKATNAQIEHGGDRACYIPSKDKIQLPHTTDFESYEHYLATSLHELCHWTGAKHRLDRDLKPRFDTKAYAAEELVAELGAAFLCAHLGVQGQLRHSEYIANWLQLLKDDNRAIFTASAKAQQAADYLRGFSEQVAEAA